MTSPIAEHLDRTTFVDDPQHRPFTLEPERAFVGCLLHTTTLTEARELLAGIRPDDAGKPATQVALSVAIHLVAREITPAPIVMLPEARNQDHLDTEHKLSRFAIWLFDTYRAAPLPELAPVVKQEMLEEALRRELKHRAQRVVEIVAHGSLDRLREQATLDTDRIVDLWHRHDTAARPITPEAPITRGTGQISAPSDRPCTPQRAIPTPDGHRRCDAAQVNSEPAHRNPHDEYRSAA
jgi:hypothetical protein